MIARKLLQMRRISSFKQLKSDDGRILHGNARLLIQPQVHPQAINNLLSQNEIIELMKVFPDVVDEFTKHQKDCIKELNQYLASLLSYNVATGKRHRAFTVVTAYKVLEKPDRLTLENIRLANIMAWCPELGAFIISDDIVDESDTRRGDICWYKKENIGLNAINDALFLKYSIHPLITRYLSGHCCYLEIVELLNDVGIKTIKGQMFDGYVTNIKIRNLDLYTMDRLVTMAKYKTGHYSFRLPLSLAMYLAGINDPQLHLQVLKFSMDMGAFYQIQNDYFDCFGDPKVTGKKGNDIIEGKCSWLAVLALQKASGGQRKLMERHYGQPDPASVEIVLNLYKELDLTESYDIYEELSLRKIQSRIEQMDKRLPQEIFVKVAEHIYGRKF